MNTMNDNIVQGCYLQYLLSKYISKACCDSKVQELETRYNAIDQISKTVPVVATTTDQ